MEKVKDILKVFGCQLSVSVIGLICERSEYAGLTEVSGVGESCL